MSEKNSGIFPRELPDLSELFFRVLRHWYIPLLTMVLAALVGLVYLQNRITEYDVSMVVSPVSPPGGAVKPSIDVGAAAGLLGIRAGTSGNVYLDQYQELLTSIELAQHIDPRSEIFIEMFSGEWDAASKTWHPPNGFSAHIRRSISEWLGAPKWEAPNAARFATAVSDDLILSPVGRTEMIRLTMRTANPDFTIRLLNTLNRTADGILRRNGLRRVGGYLSYLNQEIPKVQNNENQRALADLILEQQRQLMALNATTVTFATQTIENPTAPYLPVGMRPLRLLAVSALLGLMLGVGLVVISINTQIAQLFARIPLLRALARHR